MKTLLLILALTLASFSIMACECSEYPVDADPIVEQIHKKSFGSDITIGDSEWLKAYPTLSERLFNDFRGSSCEIIGPNQESMMMCTGKYKSDYRYSVTLASGAACTVDVQIKASIKKASAKVLRTTCP
jgi:hypothetical protein